MANKKITELNEATSISGTDWLVMVDVANDETKKIHANQVGGNIPIQDTAPDDPEEDDLWIDTNENNTLKYYDGSNWYSVSDTIAGDTLPIGAIIPYGSSTAPAGWLVCDGSAVSRTTYAELFTAIGTSYGVGDGSTTFNLPNLKGRVAVGQDTSDTDFDTIGETGGSKALQQHSHQMGNVAGYGSTTAWGFQVTQYSNMGIKSTENAGTGNSGNLQPYQVVCYIIKANQSAGLVANVSETYSTSQTDTYSCNYINNLLQTTTETITIRTINAGSGLYDQTSPITIPSGYIPIAIAGYSIAGGSSASINVARLQINGTNIEYSLYNSASSGSSASTSTLNVKVLFIKATD